MWGYVRLRFSVANPVHGLQTEMVISTDKYIIHYKLVLVLILPFFSEIGGSIIRRYSGINMKGLW